MVSGDAGGTLNDNAHVRLRAGPSFAGEGLSHDYSGGVSIFISSDLKFSFYPSCKNHSSFTRHQSSFTQHQADHVGHVDKCLFDTLTSVHIVGSNSVPFGGACAPVPDVTIPRFPFPVK